MQAGIAEASKVPASKDFSYLCEINISQIQLFDNLSIYRQVFINLSDLYFSFKHSWYWYWHSITSVNIA